MRVTIADIYVNSPLKYGFKHLKSILYQQKQEGNLFFQESVFELSPNTLFQLYYFESPTEATYVNAFPIPITKFEIFTKPVDQYKFMKRFFDSYYKRDVNPLFFKKYELDSPYVGQNFVWYYMKLSDFVKGVVN